MGSVRPAYPAVNERVVVTGSTSTPQGRQPHIRNNVDIDWMVRGNVRAKLRVLVRRILRKHGYPPDKQEKATRTVLEQAEVLSEMWAVA